MRTKRCVLIGLDGADPALVRRWMEAGKLPHIAALTRRGGWLPCASVTPPVTFPAWTTCVTGVNPGRHGIVDFTMMMPGAYKLQFLNSSDRRAPAIWNVLSSAGKRVCVLGVPGAYPPEPVNGVLVSGFDSPVATGIDASFVYPRARYNGLRGWRFADFQETHIGPGWHAMALDRLLKGLDTKAELAAKLLGEEPWDFFMAVFGEMDTASHHFWLFHDPGSPRHRPGYEDALQRVYERADAAVGRLVAAAGPDATVLVVSDHGFGGAGTAVVHLNNWLAGNGLLTFVDAGGDGDLLKRLALRWLPAKAQGALFRRLRPLAARTESRARFGQIDWDNTLAFSEELNYFPAIRVNLAGREPNGQVPAEDYDAFCSSLRASLEAWAPVQKVWHRSGVYTGPYVDRAPDLIIELALERGYSVNCLRSTPGGPAWRRLAPGEYLGGKERGMNGTHRPTGIFAASEPPTAGAASLADIAPTVLSILGVEGPPMEGRSLLEPAPSKSTTKAVPLSRLHQPSDYSPEQEQLIEARLRALGYFE